MNPITAFFGLIGSLLSGIGDSIGYLTGKVNKNRKSLAKTSELIDTKYDNISKAHAEDQNKINESINDLERGKSILSRELNKQHESLAAEKKRCDGAIILAKQRVQELGGDLEKAKTDRDYQDHMKAWQNAKDAMAKIEAAINTNKTAIDGLKDKIANQESRLSEIALKNRNIEVDRARTKANAVVLDIVETQDKDTTGSRSTNKEELEMQNLNEEMETRIKTANRRQNINKDDKYLAAAEGSANNDEFEALMGFKKTSDSPVAEPAKLPEA